MKVESVLLFNYTLSGSGYLWSYLHPTLYNTMHGVDPILHLTALMFKGCWHFFCWSAHFYFVVVVLLVMDSVN